MNKDMAAAFDAEQRARYEDYQATKQQYLTTDEVASHIRVAPETLRYWRYIGVGPPSFKAGRRVLYARADLEKWIFEARQAVK